MLTFLSIGLGLLVLLLIGVALFDVMEKKHAILRNYPDIGHLRYLLDKIGPEQRQYTVTDNDSERPFSRDQRRWIYASSKNQNNYFGFGTGNDLESGAPYYAIKHHAFPYQMPHNGDPGYDDNHPIAYAKVLAGTTGRAKAFRPESVICVSAMSYGSLGKRLWRP
jgi:glutamate synthase domain-containing protein 2